MNNAYKFLFAGTAVVGLAAVSNFALPTLFRTTYEDPTAVAARTVTENVPATSTPIEKVDNRKIVQHVPLPKPVKAIYMTACVAGTPSFRDTLVALIERTEINSVVIDIKDYSGGISFNPESEVLKGAWEHAGCGARDMEEFVQTLHSKDIYVIGRITVFQDPYYTGVRPDLAVHRADGSVWRDFKGLSFIDVSAKEYWDYILTLAEESYNIGFDELNFDYVRFPSDGPMQDIVFTHTGAKDEQEALEEFFVYLSEELADPERYADMRHENTGRASSTPYASVDLFGMTTTNTDDLSIGQVQERAAPYFDFVAPMVYPSHYPKSFLGLGNPNDHPYKVVNYAMSEGVRRMVSTTTVVDGFLHERIGTSTPPIYEKPAYTADKFRTWIQDFDYGGDYDAADVRAEIQASYDAGVHSFMIWAPSNIYTETALERATTTGVE